MIWTKLLISGTEFTDTEELNVVRRLSENSSVGEFSVTFPNVAGRHKSDFSLNQEVLVYMGSPVANGSIFTGIVEDITYHGNGIEESVTLSGRDYSARLMDVTVEPEVYTNLLCGSIVKDIVNKYVDDISIGSVQDSTTTIQRIVFNQTNAYDAIKDLADQCGYVFYVDTGKVLHFEPVQSVYSPYTLNSGNVITATTRSQRDQIYNQVWTYGDRYLAGYSELFSPGSLTGSVATLAWKPHNTYVTWEGDVKRGGVYEMSFTPSSGTQYLVNFHERQIIFTSGTDMGDNVPTDSSGLVTYDRDLPIVKFGQDRTSISQYGRRVRVDINKDIKDPNMAYDLMKATLSRYKNPITESTLKLKNISDVSPGEIIQVNLPYHNMTGSDFQVTESRWQFNVFNNRRNEVLSIKVE